MCHFIRMAFCITILPDPQMGNLGFRKEPEVLGEQLAEPRAVRPLLLNTTLGPLVLDGLVACLHSAQSMILPCQSSSSGASFWKSGAVQEHPPISSASSVHQCRPREDLATVSIYPRAVFSSHISLTHLYAWLWLALCI